MSKTNSLALELIEKEKQEKTGFLDLGNCGLTELPEDLRELAWLEELVLGIGRFNRDNEWVSSGNQDKPNHLDSLPGWLNELGELRRLWLGGAWGKGKRWALNDLSPLAELKNLRSLGCSGTEIADISPLSGLRNLEMLDCSVTCVTDLSPLKGLCNLREIYCSGTQVADLSAISDSRNLEILFCTETKVEDLSPLGELHNLQSLGFRATPVSDLSPLAGLDKLYYLDCTDTRVNDLAPLRGLENLATVGCGGTGVFSLQEFVPRILNGWPVKWERFVSTPGIYVESCPLINPPVEFASKGHWAVLEYFDQLGKEGRAVNEIKVIFLGQGASGKTSLIKRLREEPFDPKESQTHGVRIRETPFDIDGEIVTAHLWDFGGQDVMNATHQFFLSQRCVYVLVLNSRADDKAEHWLKHAQSFGGKSPVLVVLNKIDENHSFEVNRKGLAEKYPQIQEFYRLSCLTGQGLAEFRAALAAEIDHAPVRRTPFPIHWLAVKERFARLDQDYIESAEYQAICEQLGVNRPFSQAVLLQFLHDLGLVINFHNLKNFDTQILNPLWLTNGVYRIVNSERVAKQGGQFHESDLDAIINDPRYTQDNISEKRFHYPLDKFNYIVRIMEEFELCYPLEGHRHIVPNLLPVPEPPFQQQGAVLHFAIHFPDFLPNSVFPRLMVKLHAYIKGELRWRTGMVLEKRIVFGDATARVRVDNEDKRIQIDVCGKEPRRFLSFIRETVKEIVADFANLPYTEWVPIPDNGEFLEYGYLVDAESAGETEVFVRQVKKRIPVADLLDGVEEPAMRGQEAQTPVKAFVSYAHKDLEYLQALRAALKPLERLDKVRFWDDRDINAGTEWNDTIFRELNEADLVLCLVSQDFIASEFCYTQELAAAMAAHQRGEKTVVPIRLRDCAWDDLPLARIQGTPGQWITSAANKDAAWTEVAKSLKPAIDQAKTRKTQRG